MNSGAEDDDPWLDEDVSDRVVAGRNASQEYQALTSRFTDAGYRDGITAGQAATVQAGFDQGYTNVGAPLGKEVGILRGAAAGLLSLLTSNSSYAFLELEETAKAGLVERARELVRRLGKIKLQDIAPRDLEAEAHALEHGEEIVVPQKLQEKREMQLLEDDLESLGARSTSLDQKSLSGPDELAACQHELRALLEACRLCNIY